MSFPPGENFLGPVYTTADSERMAERLGIGPKDRVLDVGGGFYPFRRADVITDVSFSDASNRNGAQMLFTEGNRYVECAAEKLPFRDREFDFVFCSHVLEHTRDPEAACREIQRVGKRGYIEVPHKVSEYLTGNPTHRWLVTPKDGGLRFEPKNFIESPLQNVLHSHIVNDAEFQAIATGSFRNLLNIQLAWKGSFPVEVVRQVERGARFDYDDPRQAGLSHLVFAFNNLKYDANCEYALCDAIEATRFLPDDPDSWHVLGIYYLRLLMLREGRECVAKARNLRPGDATVEHNLALAERFVSEHRCDLRQVALPCIRKTLEPASPCPAPPATPAASPLVSILYRASLTADAIREGFSSIAAQRYPSREAIIVSEDPDAARRALSGLETDMPVRHVVAPAGSSPGIAFNSALREAKGEIIAYLDRDQLYQVYHLPRLVGFLNASQEAVAYSDALRLTFSESPGAPRRYAWDSQVILSHELDPRDLASNAVVPIGSIVHRRACADAVGGLDSQMRELLGRDLLTRLSRSFRIHHIREITLECRVPTASAATAADPGAVPEEGRRLLDRYSHFEPLELMRKVVELYNTAEYLRHQLEQVKR